jgi:hypothetical protein
MRLSRLQSIICQLAPRNIRLSAARPPNLFPARPPLLRTDRPPSLSVRIHSLVPRLLYGVSSPFLLAARLRATVLPGFRPSSRHHRKRPLVREFPFSRYVPSSGFLNLPTGYSAFDFAGLLHPAATSRVPPSRGFSRSTAVPTRRRSVPPCRCRPNTHRPKPAAALERLDFEALLREPIRSSGLVFSLPRGRSPLRLPPPSGSAHPP